MKGATSNLATKSDLISSKTEEDELDIDKLKIVSNNSSKLSNAVGNDVVKETLYDELFTKLNAIDSSKLVKKLTLTHKN